MTAPRPNPKDATGTEKRRLDRALQEGLEETFSGLGAGECHPAAALESGPSRLAQGLAPRHAAAG